jgi:protein Tex
VQIRTLEERLPISANWRSARRRSWQPIDEQGKLTPSCETRIEATRQKTELEDLYLPYKPRRRTKATIARERGLEPLADLIAAQALTSGTPEEAPRPSSMRPRGGAGRRGGPAGGRDILAERSARTPTYAPGCAA